ncbi:MAG: aspartate kinase [Planctomycetes bacterium]|nr:aspartate kinase [Planctomycetota bacterium]
MIVMKFGGTSVGSAERIQSVAQTVKASLPRGPIVVVSAHSQVTDLLIGLARKAVKGQAEIDEVRERHLKIIADLGLKPSLVEKLLNELEVLLKGISLVKELTPRTLDYVLSFGERMSVRTVAAAFEKAGLQASPVDAFDLGMLTDSNFGSAVPLPEADNIIAWNVKRFEKLPVVTGYIGKNKDGDITTLGRNGSDYTAAILGAACGAEEIQIWSDVDGVCSADPGIVKNAHSIEEMSFDEASELAYYGGRIHPATLVPAVKKDIPIRLKNTYRPENPGTLIRRRAPVRGIVKSVVYKEDLFLINLVSTRMLLHHGFMSRIFEVFGKYGIVIDMIATSEVSVSLTVDSDRNLEPAIRELADIAEVQVEGGKAIICVVGEGIRNELGVSGQVFTAMKDAGLQVQMISQSAMSINIAFLVNNDQIPAGVNALHETFFGKRAEPAPAGAVAGPAR